MSKTVTQIHIHSVFALSCFWDLNVQGIQGAKLLNKIQLEPLQEHHQTCKEVSRGI